MSKYMISDAYNINDINPFVLIDPSLPGSFAQPYEFAEYKKPVEEPAMFDIEEPSISCEYHTALGPNKCETLVPNCPMSRLLLPERVIQYEDGSVNTELGAAKKKSVLASASNNKLSIALIILIILLVGYVLTR